MIKKHLNICIFYLLFDIISIPELIHMLSNISIMSESLVTLTALKRFLPRVCPYILCVLSSL